MYLAEFSLGALTFKQGCIQVGLLATRDRTHRELWWSTLHQQLQCYRAVGKGYPALRILLNANGDLRYTHLFSSGPEVEPNLRSYLASFTRLGNLIDGSVHLPLDREQYDQLTGDFPRYQHRVDAYQFFVDDAYIACDFRLWPRLNEILAEARMLGHRLGYQIHLLPWLAAPEQHRHARKNLLRVQNFSGVPGSIVSMQERLVGNIATSTALFEEIVAMDSEVAADWLAGVLRRLFDQSFGSFRFEAPEFAFVEDAFEGQLTLAVHSGVFEEPSLAEMSATAMDADGVSQVLAWRPPLELEGRLSSSLQAAEAGEEVAEAVKFDASGLFPPPYQGTEEFVFISYSHKDVETIAPVLIEFQRQGIKFWYDRGIPGGAEWDW